MRSKSGPVVALAAAFLALLGAPAAGQGIIDNPFRVCERAAAKAEHAWSLPAGLLSAIGLVESGRADFTTDHRVAWPWAVNAAGFGYLAPSKPAAIAMVRAFQERGIRTIDVGCFQVDLFYHPWAFATLEEAFDPDANADAAAAILSRNRFGGTGWERAVALYHSADLVRGGVYSQRVFALWPWARAHIATVPLDGVLPAYVALLSPQARLVKVVMPLDAAPAPAVSERSAARRAYGHFRHAVTPEVIYISRPANLPVVLLPSHAAASAAPGGGGAEVPIPPAPAAAASTLMVRAPVGAVLIQLAEPSSSGPAPAR
jgi:hypothetical protein